MATSFIRTTAVVLAAATALTAGMTAPAAARRTFAASSLRVTDEAAAAGIARVTNDSFGNSLVFDYNSDGVADLLLSNHQLQPAELFRGNANGTFTKVRELPVADRHYCTSGDFDGDRRPDFFCTIGASGGHSDSKSNQLWLQRSPGTFTMVAGAWGAADPAGRGRDVATLDANNDGRPDLFIGNGSGRNFPSSDKLFLNRRGSFAEHTGWTANPRGGGICVAPADYNRDGRTDIFVCGRPNHLYTALRATTTYRDDAGRLGINTEQGKDAQWGDLNGDGKLDLVVVGDTMLRVWLRQPGGFTNSYSRPLQAGRNAGVADLDRDGHLDIYVVQGRAGGTGPNVADVLLLGGGNGTSFTKFSGLPQASTGGGNEVSVIPHYNGRPALVVTNGGDGDRFLRGPRQLLVFHS